ncbi:MAG: hypothetical protein LBS29_05020 [Endomicrobium sp.]|jgi:hypothetical protein|nr:hypothetical protein [Endomicrobium sp.]
MSTKDLYDLQLLHDSIQEVLSPTKVYLLVNEGSWDVFILVESIQYSNIHTLSLQVRRSLFVKGCMRCKLYLHIYAYADFIKYAHVINSLGYVVIATGLEIGNILLESKKVS